MALLPQRFPVRLKTLLLFFLCALTLSAIGAPQKLIFLPPPMDGTLSMGVYAQDGKLVRTLHSMEDVQSDAFDKALDGLITSWDGNDDAGQVVPDGGYAVRGMCVGALAVEGVAYLGNDWIEDEDSPFITGIERIDLALVENVPTLVLSANVSGGGVQKFVVSGSEAQLKPVDEAALQGIGIQDGSWQIEVLDGRSVVAQIGAAGEPLRTMVIAADQPQPRMVAASSDGTQVFLLESAPGIQRVRGLRLVPGSEEMVGEKKASTWEEFFVREIRNSSSLEAALPLLKFPNGSPFVPQEIITLNLIANAMDQEKPGSAKVKVAVNEKGCLLMLSDGLPLVQLTDTPALRWAAIGREQGSKTLILFQSNGTVIEEFHITRTANMMAFDLGEFSR